MHNALCHLRLYAQTMVTVMCLLNFNNVNNYRSQRTSFFCVRSLFCSVCVFVFLQQNQPVNFLLEMYFSAAWFTALLVQLTAATKIPIVQIADQENAFVIENGYVRVTVDKITEAISELSADFSGASDFRTNVLARPFTLSTTFMNATRTSNCGMKRNDNIALARAQYSITSQSDDLVELVVTGIRDCAFSSVAEENWHISLHRAERFVQVRIEGGTTAAAVGESVVSIGHGIYTHATSLYGLFDRGVVQMMNNIGKCLGSDQPVNRLYALGNDQSVDVLYRTYPAANSNFFSNSTADSTSHLSGPAEVVLYSEFGGATSSVDTFFGSGFQDVLVGAYPRKSLGKQQELD
jgi:hypothetical protein